MSVVYTGRVFFVEVERRRFPNGSEHEVAIVRHPPSVVLIPVEADGKIVLIKQYRAPLDRDTWECPAGSLNPGETAEAAAILHREGIGFLQGYYYGRLSLDRPWLAPAVSAAPTSAGEIFAGEAVAVAD